MHSTFLFSLLASTVIGQLSESNLRTHIGSCKLSAEFSPIKDAYWTGLPHHRRTPFAVSPDGKSAYLAYLDASETDVHVQKVDPSTFAAVGDAVTVKGGKEAGGLVAHNDGFALLTNEAMPSGTANAPPDNTPVAALYRYTGGKQTFKTFLGGPDNAGHMGAQASPDMNGDLAFSEATGMYGAYFVVTAYSGPAQGHFGDAIQYVSENGTLEQIPGASSSWGCSHNTGIAFEASDSVPFASICAEDQGALWLNTGGTGMAKSGVKISNENVQNGANNEAMGGMSGSYSGLARFIDSDSYIFTWVSRGAKDLTQNEWMGAGYTTSKNRTVNRNVAIATFSDKKTIVGEEATSEIGPDGDSQVNWITTGSADCQNAHVAALDSTNAVVTWEEIAQPTCEFISMGCKGEFTGSYFQLVKDGNKVGEPVKSMDVYVAGDMVTMADGRVCWPYVDMDWTLNAPVPNPVTVKAISFACMGLDGAGESTPAASSAAVASKTPAASSKAPIATSAAAEKPAPAGGAAESTPRSSVAEIPTAPSSPSTTVTATPTATPQIPGVGIIDSIISGIFDDDKPAPSESVYIPASESFNSILDPAFTNILPGPAPTIVSDLPSISASEITEAPTFSSPPAPIPTVEPTTSTHSSAKIEPIPSTEPSSETYQVVTSTTRSPVITPSIAPPAETPEAATSTPCTEGEAQSTGTPLDTVQPETTVATGVPSAPVDEPVHPTSTGSRYEGFGWGRPRPSDMWPAVGYARPTGGFPRPPKPFARLHGSQGAGVAKASRKPCTLETRVRPTPAPTPLVH